ncbi:SH3 domain-containing protein [Streptomyces sp. LP05-1]|uniref:SH3 domain-containing protein n=1 Tax=Streptomyces pyxinae TaxID=2970734 RepID=A0ABT2CM69_9ACTN|nr:SH3 domain-containing protein [Streptomyces sp. LP05-1]MCS0638523.1 SH3 domain-containing protein [Streptomyces sp. LP05-1]
MKRRLAAIVPAVAMAALAVPLITTTPAAAHAPCGKTAADKDGSAWGAWANGANTRSGSGIGCISNGIAYNTQRLDYHCYTVGNDGKTWTYLRNDSTGVTGWIRDDLLSNGGSLVYCGF